MGTPLLTRSVQDLARRAGKAAALGALIALAATPSAGVAGPPDKVSSAAPIRPRPIVPRAAARPPPEPYCGGVKLRARPGGQAFQAGEELAYELTIAGMSVGRMETKVGRPRSIDGKQTISLFGRARTTAFASSIKKFSGRYMTLVDPEAMVPVGLRVESTYGDDPRWEKARFGGDNHKVSASFLVDGKEGSRSYEFDERLTDVLALLYFARTRELPFGAQVCQHVFGARWLWRMDARVKGLAKVDTPAGQKDATVVATSFRRSPHPDLRPEHDQRIDMEVYFARDRTQAPLKFVIHTGAITAEGKLVRWSLDDHGEDGWSF